MRRVLIRSGKIIFILFAILWLSITGLQAQEYDQAIGLRVGDPFGISYKIYKSDSRAIEFIGGASGSNWHTTYYRKSFDRISKFNNALYDGHRVDYSLAFSARYLFQKSISPDVDGFKWYYGAGLHMRFASVEYKYIDRSQAGNPFLADRFFDNHNNFDVGPEGVIGMEYTLYDAPLTLFMETSLFGEIVDNPLSFRFFGAIGIRFNFNK
jgi:hypothetical protein